MVNNKRRRSLGVLASHASSSYSAQVRERPTGLARRRRQELIREHMQDPIIETEVPHDSSDSSEPHDLVEEPISKSVADGSHDSVVEDISGPIPGGPLNEEVISSFRSHIAFSIWRGTERPVLKCINHALKVTSWPLPENCEEFDNLVQQSGLSPLINCSHKYISKALVSAFVERWQPETNTFHLPFGEMSITLDDVSTLLGITTVGKGVSVDNIEKIEDIDLIVQSLGVSRTAAFEEFNNFRGSGVRLEWLKENCSDINEVGVEKSVRAYLLYILGCTIFADKTCTRVSITYLYLLKDLSMVGGYAWGAACLAFLYRQLGRATRSNCRQIAGYLSLLQSWIFEYFPFFRPSPNLKYQNNLPRSCRWIIQKEGSDPDNALKLNREKLDGAREEKIIWEPYKDVRNLFPIPDSTFYSGCIRALYIIEPYHPQRFLRQFRIIQTIPPEPIKPTFAIRGTKANSYRIDFPSPDFYWNRWEDHLIQARLTGGQCRLAWDSVSGYLDWYRSISHPIVQNPEKSDGSHPGEKDTNLLHRVDEALRIGETTLATGQHQPIENVLGSLNKIVELLRGDRSID